MSGWLRSSLLLESQVKMRFTWSLPSSSQSGAQLQVDCQDIVLVLLAYAEDMFLSSSFFVDSLLCGYTMKLVIKQFVIHFEFRIKAKTILFARVQEVLCMFWPLLLQACLLVPVSHDCCLSTYGVACWQHSRRLAEILASCYVRKCHLPRNVLLDPTCHTWFIFMN